MTCVEQTSPFLAKASEVDVPWCFEGAGVLEAMRVMAEHHTKRVLVLNAERSPVGWFELRSSRISYLPHEGA